MKKLLFFLFLLSNCFSIIYAQKVLNTTKTAEHVFLPGSPIALIPINENVPLSMSPLGFYNADMNCGITVEESLENFEQTKEQVTLRYAKFGKIRTYEDYVLNGRKARYITYVIEDTKITNANEFRLFNVRVFEFPTKTGKLMRVESRLVEAYERKWGAEFDKTFMQIWIDENRRIDLTETFPFIVDFQAKNLRLDTMSTRQKMILKSENSVKGNSQVEIQFAHKTYDANEINSIFESNLNEYGKEGSKIKFSKTRDVNFSDFNGWETNFNSSDVETPVYHYVAVVSKENLGMSIKISSNNLFTTTELSEMVKNMKLK
jgi:hypothetical protein